MAERSGGLLRGLLERLTGSESREKLAEEGRKRREELRETFRDPSARGGGERVPSTIGGSQPLLRGGQAKSFDELFPVGKRKKNDGKDPSFN
jgi:hypothetical protein